ncbi:MAG: hypothetical protein A2381_17710 [Bdellovibrionales bacterium RIFOXYB1_FULL_37_110]|nr:MAG: hypothetical protein A2417_08500 [Bdellovibrionales bacterium RIFOXYC1_FULL_37_79]OFZ59809.1 MAG: hypothetical protein A2381_17710 [Bdellovibrionales bacterium RIFOXYB1_FULL_37_110]OFZ65424.1 MAG: hypothetical protein A2577_18245 [Bdellovibrionales bacterium RIFOXYD1_FULL_36_51]
MVTRLLRPRNNYSFFLLGPRQTGKTFLINATFPKETTQMYNLLNTDEYMRYIANPSLFRNEVIARDKKITHIFVDEIQKIPDLLNEIHSILENPNIDERSKPYFILSGSSARKLKRANANMLAGRAITYALYPLSYQELKDNFDLLSVLKYGTLPRIYLEKDDSLKKEILRSYVETYLKEEIEQEALIRNVGSFVRFLNISGHESGNIINYSNISKDTGVSHITVKEYFKILEDTLIGNFLFPFGKSKRKRLGRHPKFYYLDTGVIRTLCKKLNNELEPATTEYGSMFEHWIINETLMLNSYLKKDLVFSFYRTEHGAEIDLIIETPKNEIIAVEIKSSETPNPTSYMNGFKSFSGAVKKIHKKIVVCNAKYQSKEDDIDIYPWKTYFDFIMS